MSSPFKVHLNPQVDPTSPWLSIIYKSADETRNLSEALSDNDHNCSIYLGLPPLDENYVEQWPLLNKADQIKHNDFLVILTESFMFVAGQTNPLLSPVIQTQDLYNRLLDLAKSEGYHFPQRIWNYVPWINEGSEDEETYRQFCLGRHRSFERFGLHESDYCSASAVGTDADRLTVYMLLTKDKGAHFDNPKQQSAFRYPRQYGPKSPSFARATRIKSPDLLFISGTASIIGHQTLFFDDVSAQTQQSIENIQSLVESISTKCSEVYSLAFVKVYIRHPEDYSVVAKKMRGFIGDAPTLYVKADICRADLLVEIEALYRPQ